MFSRIINLNFGKVFAICIVMLLSGCLSSANKQISNQLNNIDVNVSEDQRGLVITLPTVYFDFDSSNLKAESRTKIAQIAEILNQRRAKKRVIEIEGHTDNVGDPGYNLNLSAERADVVLKELVFSNISESRLSASGLGETSPVADNASSEGRQANRRVEIILLNP